MYVHAEHNTVIYICFSLSVARRNNYGESLMAFFNPRESGMHSFYVASDDGSEVLFAAGSNISEVTRHVIARCF